MSRPLGSKNKPRTDSLMHPNQSTITDGFLQAFTGAGTRRDRSSYTKQAQVHLLQQRELESLYVGDGMARRVIDIPAEDMTRSGIELENLDDDDLKEHVESRMDELDAMKHFNDAIRWSRLHGGSVMIFGLNDGGTLDTPLNLDGIRSVEFLRVYDRWQATVNTRVTDPESEQYGQPEQWLISPVAGGTPYYVHNSRLHMFDGAAVPDYTRQMNLGWGASVLQSCQDQLTRLGMGHQWTNMLLERSQQAVHGIPKLTQLLNAPGGEAMVQKRVDMVDMVRSVLNTVVIDGEESFAVSTQAMTGVPDVLDRFAEMLCAVTGIPVSELMTRSAGGLNSTGKGEQDKWYARVESMWNDELRKPEDRLITYIMIAKNGEAPPYKLCMRPLAIVSDAEKAAIDVQRATSKKLAAETAVLYLTNQVIFTPEVRAGLEDDYELEESLDLTPEEVKQAMEDDKAAEEAAAAAALNPAAAGAANGF